MDQKQIKSLVNTKNKVIYLIHVNRKKQNANYYKRTTSFFYSNPAQDMIQLNINSKQIIHYEENSELYYESTKTDKKDLYGKK